MRAERALQTRNAGFTLIELLVVVLIIGVVMSFVSLSLDPSGPADQLDTEAKRLDALTGAAADDAILYGREIGLDITRGGYRFLRLGDDGWRPIDAPDSPLRPRRLADGLVLALINRDEDTPQLTSGSKDDKKKKDAVRPEALFLSSGETVPFELELYADGVDHLYHLSADAGGKLVLKRVEANR